MNIRNMFFSLLGILAVGYATCVSASTYTNTVGDLDFAATRNGTDGATNMDYFVMPSGVYPAGTFDPIPPSTIDPYPTTNDKGLISWEHILPTNFGFLTNGSMEIRAFDVDPADKLYVTYFLNGLSFIAGELTSLPVNNTIQVPNWEGFVATGTTETAQDGFGNSLWTTTVISLPQAVIDSINGSPFSTLHFHISNTNTQSWGGVVDYSRLTLDYEAVPEPATMILFGSGILGLLGYRSRRTCQKVLSR